MASSPKDPILSVVIPSRDCLPYLPGALNSVKTQGINDLEILIGDDSSSDDTWPWLLEQQRLDSRIRCFRYDFGNPSGVRNALVREARSNLIAFLDADDEWLPEKLRTQLEFHRRNQEVVLSFTDYEYIDSKGRSAGHAFNYWDRFKQLCRRISGFVILHQAQTIIFSENIVGTSTVLIRRAAFDDVNGFDETLPSAADWDLWLRMAGRGPVAFTSGCYTIYRMRPDSISSALAKRIEAVERIMERHQQAICRLYPGALRLARANLAATRAEYECRRGHLGAAFRYRMQAFLNSPTRRLAHDMAADGFRFLTGRRRR